jgi:hypothetical protein
MRMEGAPTITPKKAESRPDRGRQSQKGRPSRVVRMSGAVGPDADKSRVAQGNLPGRAGEDVEPHRADDGHACEVGHVKQIIARHKGKHGYGHQQAAQPEARGGRAEHGLVRRIVLFVIAYMHEQPSWRPARGLLMRRLTVFQSLACRTGRRA